MKQFVIIVIVAALGYLAYSQLNGGDGIEGGVYVNTKHGFQIDVPRDWQIVSEDAVNKAGFITRGPQDNRLFAVKGNADEGLLSIALIDLGQTFTPLHNEEDRKTYISRFASAGFDVQQEGIKEVNGVRMLRIKGLMNKRHSEMSFFEVGDTVVQIAIELPSPISRATHIEIRRVINSVALLSQ